MLISLLISLMILMLVEIFAIWWFIYGMKRRLTRIELKGRLKLYRNCDLKTKIKP